jgi:hypothetical protein
VAKIFIGGSIQALPALREIEECLSSAGHEAEAWDSEAYYGGEYPLDHLLERVERLDGAVFVFSESDRQPEESQSLRDRALTELGLFLGTHGRRRVVVCYEGKRRPNNLVGVTYVDVTADKREVGRRKLERWASELGTQAKPRIVRHGGDVAEIIKRFPIESYKIKLQRSQVASILELFLPFDHHMELIESDLLQMLDEMQGSMQILLCDPSSVVCKLREASLAPLGVDVQAEIVRSLRHLREVRGKLPEAARERLEVRLYSTLPSASIYRTDDMVLGGNHFHDLLAIDGPQFRTASQGSVLGERLIAEHQRIWELPNTRKVDLASDKSF